MTRSFGSDKFVTAMLAICTFAFYGGAKLYADTAGTLIMLKEGTEVKLNFAEDISSRTAALDDPVALILAEDLKVGDVTIAQAGAKAYASVSNVKKAGMMGKPGELNIRLEWLKVEGTKIKLRGSKGREGDSRTGTAIALTVLFGPVGLIKHGKNIEVKQGTSLTAYVADDVAISQPRH